MTRQRQFALKFEAVFGLTLLFTAIPAQIRGQAPEAPKAPAQAQEPPIVTNTPIRTESRIVLVDAVVTDKKGNYVHDLKQPDFKVYQATKTQQIASFSFGSDRAAPANSQ